MHAFPLYNNIWQSSLKVNGLKRYPCRKNTAPCSMFSRSWGLTAGLAKKVFQLGDISQNPSGFLKEQCYISCIFFFPFFLAFLQTSYGFILIKTNKLHFLYIQRQQIAAKSLSLERFYLASIFAFSQTSNILFAKQILLR